ncbi:hypothetical protein [Nocardia tenerifensis]|uniref:hypothetical protein n=1 Tax=Nocardia tenerifensis TaxID=228006 RepID=UPI0011B4963F|nr:hypothetical protein [Nocardia tenerifensis]
MTWQVCAEKTAQFVYVLLEGADEADRVTEPLLVVYRLRLENVDAGPELADLTRLPCGDGADHGGDGHAEGLNQLRAQ